MSRAFVKEDDNTPPPRFALPARNDPGFPRAAARALLQGANQGDSASAEDATGYRWGDARLLLPMEQILAEAVADKDDRLEQLAERFLGKAREALPPAPELLTFDIFGTVLDWRTGLLEACRRAGDEVLLEEFDDIIDVQAELESEAFQPYAAITAQSLVEVLDFPADVAAEIGAGAGTWPLYPDSREALRQLLTVAPCAAMTNSDRRHGEQVRDQLGFPLTHWFCAEDLGLYKPARGFWDAVAAETTMPFGPAWWHVSAYADYDVETAAAVGLTTVFVRRPHCRLGPATLEVGSLIELVALAKSVIESPRSKPR